MKFERRGDQRRWLGGALAALLFLSPLMAAATDFEQKFVIGIQPSGDVADCFYFRLEGVTQPGPAANGPWFAMARTQYGAKDAYALLLAAKLTGTPVSVRSTSTSVACGRLRCRECCVEFAITSGGVS